jgi:hypothetical protein
MGTMSFDLAAVGRAVVARLRAVAPPAVGLSAAGTRVLISGNGGVWAAFDMADFGVGPTKDPEALAAVLERVLDMVQDFVIEEFAEPWPPDDLRAPESPRGAISLPMVEALPDRFRLWFGRGERPALELPPILMSELAHDAGQGR